MAFLELFDETLDINSTENYELSVQVSPDSLAFCILDTIRNKFILIRSFESEPNKCFNAGDIREIISGDDFLAKKFKKTRIIMPSRKFTIVPSALFDPGKKEDYFTFNHLREDNEIIIANKISEPDSYVISSVSKTIAALINDLYPGIHPVQHLKPLFHHIVHTQKNKEDNHIHLHIERDYFNLIIFNNNSLKFCNAFNYRNVSDILYFVLNVFKTLDIKQEETVYFSGLAEKYDDLSSGFSIYIRHLKFAEPTGNFTFSYVFNETNLHHFLNLFTIVNCE